MRPPDEASVDAAIESAYRSGELDLSGIQLGEVPAEVHSLRELRVLTLAGCGLKTVPEWLSDLRILHRLDLSRNPIKELPPELSRLRMLSELSLAYTAIDDLDDQFPGMDRVERLSLRGTPLKSTPPWIDALRELRVLDLGGTGIEQLSEDVAQLKLLTVLILWGHRFDVVPDAICRLLRLEVLDLSNREDSGDPLRLGPGRRRPDRSGADSSRPGCLAELPDGLYALPRLRVLTATGQRIRRVARLPPSLEQLWLGANELHEVPSWVPDHALLEVLDLSDNEISRVPGGLADMKWLRYLDLRGNPVSLPPEVLEAVETPRRILDFVVPTGEPVRRLDEAKLLVVGEGSVGKTSLIRRLILGSFSALERRTEGIEVQRWDVHVGGALIGLNVWDFGGQEIMHATHQFFLTKRSLYVLVIDARQGEEQNRIEYWLKLIHSFGGQSPVILVGNKSEESPLDLDERGLQAKYPNLVDILPISCRTGAGIDELRRRLASALEHMPHVRDLLPAAFFDVKRVLEQLDDDYITYADYEQVCVHHRIEDPTACESLIGFLHDLGTVLCFRDDPRLLDTNILNPEWVTGGVYRLLNSHLASQRKGLLTLDDIDEILDTDEYPRERRTFIVDVMKRFELCYESDGTFLIPDLLVKQEPDTGSWNGALTFQIKYEILPTSVISRLIVRMHSMISHGTVWRTGLVVAMDGNRAFVKADREDAVISIAVDGPDSGRRGLLTAVRTELRAIARTIPGLVGEERVPVPGHEGVYVPYDHLLRLEAADREMVVPEGLVEDFRVRDLLAGVETADSRYASSDPEPGAATGPRTDEGRAWDAHEAWRFGIALLLGLIVILAAFVGAVRAIGPSAAGIVLAAMIAMVLLAVIVLRAAGRLSETGFLAALREALARTTDDSSR